MHKPDIFMAFKSFGENLQNAGINVGLNALLLEFYLVQSYFKRSLSTWLSYDDLIG